MSGDPYFLHRYRRAEGSGPWLHPPRPARPARRHRSIGLRYILLAALALAALTGSAMAAPIHHQPPVPVPVNLPATGWLMLVGLGALLIKGKSYTT